MTKLLEKQNLIDYLASPSDYKSDFVTLPNALVALWTSNGFPFHMSFNLDEKDSVDGIACWWPRNQFNLNTKLGLEKHD